MSCNGCRVLRKGCSESCVLRPCLQWIETAQAQGHATVFVAKFFGRAGLMSFISNVLPSQRPALFQSLLFEACGRTINPVNGAVGLLWTGNWHLCEAAVETVLRGGTLRSLPELVGEDQSQLEAGGEAGVGLYVRPKMGVSFSTAKRPRNPNPPQFELDESVVAACELDLCLTPQSPGGGRKETRLRRPATPSINSEGSVTTSGDSGGLCAVEPKLLSLFV